MTRRLFIFTALTVIAVAYGYVSGTIVFSTMLGIVLGGYLAALDWQLESYNVQQLLGGGLGFGLGLITSLFFIDTLLSPVTLRKPEVVLTLGIGVYVGTYIGVQIGQKWPESTSSSPSNEETHIPDRDEDDLSKKIVDTSVIIDGRIAEVIEIGFLEGTLLIPRFILKELQSMADSGQNLKRNRGRRGLDILNRIREELPIHVEIVERDFPDIPEVDAKLVELAQELEAKIITNDFNLNKVANLQDVPVLNINDLSNAVKPVYIPGESFEIEVIKKGEEDEQGVGYLEDGTMVVIENALDEIGNIIPVTVTSVIQTSAGRMVFAQKGENESFDE